MLIAAPAPVAGAIAATILAAAALVHVYWALGGRRGHRAAIPERHGQPVLRPNAAVTLAVSAALLAAAGLLAIRSGVIAAPALEGVAALAAWALAAIFTARAIGDFRYVGFFKRITGSRFARLDSTIFSPLCLLLGLLAGLVAAS